MSFGSLTDSHVHEGHCGTAGVPGKPVFGFLGWDHARFRQFSRFAFRSVSLVARFWLSDYPMSRSPDLVAPPPPLVIPDWRGVERHHPKVIPIWRRLQQPCLHWRRVQKNRVAQPLSAMSRSPDLVTPPPPPVIPDWRGVERHHPKVIPIWRRLQQPCLHWRRVQKNCVAQPPSAVWVGVFRLIASCYLLAAQFSKIDRASPALRRC